MLGNFFNHLCNVAQGSVTVAGLTDIARIVFLVGYNTVNVYGCNLTFRCRVNCVKRCLKISNADRLRGHKVPVPIVKCLAGL